MSLEVLDWRRRVAALYAAVRAEPVARSAHEIWRAGRDRLLAAHPASPVPKQERSQFRGARYAPYDPDFRFVVPVEESNGSTMSVETGTDGLVRFQSLGTVTLGDLGSLEIWWLLAYGGGLFVPMRDTNREGYSGGRYVLDTVKGADLGTAFNDETGTTTLVIDLNFAYNPSCAYDPAWACPLAPPSNWLHRAVNAGELH